MGILDQTRFVERLEFFNGQRLFAEDLQGIEAFHREMRWLHNLTLHQPGIGNGFQVTGKRDGRELRIGPGYAIDGRGREIVLTREVVEPVPPVAGESEGEPVFFDLVVSYDEDPEVAETRQGICVERGVVRLREEPVLCFVRLKRGESGVLQPVDPKLGKEIQEGLRVLLARVEVVDCKLRQDPSLAERRSARPSRQPFIACGETEIPNVGNTFTKPDPTNPNLYLLHKEIDTTAAGFQTTPCYSVRLERRRVVRDDQGNILFYILDSSPQILAPGPKSFTVETLFEVREIDFGDPGVVRARAILGDPKEPRDGWSAVWMGVE